MLPDGSRCLPVALDARRCFEMCPDASRCVQMLPDASAWFEMPPDAFICFQMAPDPVQSCSVQSSPVRSSSVFFLQDQHEERPKLFGVHCLGHVRMQSCFAAEALPPALAHYGLLSNNACLNAFTHAREPSMQFLYVERLGDAISIHCYLQEKHG